MPSSESFRIRNQFIDDLSAIAEVVDLATSQFLMTDFDSPMYLHISIQPSLRHRRRVSVEMDEIAPDTEPFQCNCERERDQEQNRQHIHDACNQVRQYVTEVKAPIPNFRTFNMHDYGAADGGAPNISNVNQLTEYPQLVSKGGEATFSHENLSEQIRKIQKKSK